MVSKFKVKKYRADAYLNYILESPLPTMDSEKFQSDSRLFTIKPVACSDGCSPKYRTRFGLIGIPDGPLRALPSGRIVPVTFRSFFLHDVLLEARNELGITALKCHREFELEMNRTDFRFKSAYIKGVYLFGPKD